MKQKKITFGMVLLELLIEARAEGEERMSSYRLAQLTGVKAQAIGRYLSGKNDPTFAVVLRIARALNVSLAVFDNVTLPEPKG